MSRLGDHCHTVISRCCNGAGKIQLDLRGVAVIIWRGGLYRPTFVICPAAIRLFHDHVTAAQTGGTRTPLKEKLRLKRVSADRNAGLNCKQWGERDESIEGIVNIVPVRSIRQYPLPLVNSDDDSIADDEWVMRIIHTINSEAAHFVPIIRPMIPQTGFQTGTSSSNSLMIVERYGNVRRLTQLVLELVEHPEFPDD